MLSRRAFDATSSLRERFLRVCISLPLHEPEICSQTLGRLHTDILLSMIIRQEIPYARVLVSVPREMRERLPPELTGILETSVSIICLQHYSEFNLTQNDEEAPKARASPPRC